MTNVDPAAGRRPSRLVTAIQNAVTTIHVFVYRYSGGAIGGRAFKSPVLLLTTKGRKSGKRRTVPLLYLEDGNRVVLVASNGGAAKHPTWWLNLEANPKAEIQIGRATHRVQAEQASAAEKRRLWPLLTAMYPPYQRYQDITGRDIPVVMLKRS